jgi:hypothetical protein
VGLVAVFATEAFGAGAFFFAVWLRAVELEPRVEAFFMLRRIYHGGAGLTKEI